MLGDVTGRHHEETLGKNSTFLRDTRRHWDARARRVEEDMIKQLYIPPTEVREDPAELANVRAKALRVRISGQ